MVFSSSVFLFLFLPLVLLAYYICPHRGRNTLLLLVSLFFYAWGEPKYLPLMLGTICLNYVSGLMLSRAGDNVKAKKAMLAAAVVLNLLLLGIFKYAVFAVDTLHSLIPITRNIRVPDISLPLGISFFIFQSMSYVIDLYRGKVELQKNPIVFGTYVSLFPQLVAGPIVRYSDVAHQFYERRENLRQFSKGVELFIIGLSKKLLLANKMGLLWSSLQISGGMCSAWVGMLAYTMQIYFDFSGYSDMAIGLGKMFGFEFPLNFNYPYVSQSVTEFWRRWHITLSSWFREYVYIPLGGNHRGPVRQYLNIFIVWSLTGLWHGASWNFVLWGVYYAVILCVEKLVFLKHSKSLPSFVRVVAVMLTVSVGWMLFYFEDMAELLRFLGRLLSFKPEDVYTLRLILAYLPLLLISVTASSPLPKRLFNTIKNKRLSGGVLLLWLAILMLLCTAALSTQSYNPFIYFRF